MYFFIFFWLVDSLQGGKIAEEGDRVVVFGLGTVGGLWILALGEGFRLGW